jgi:hypothetical protein
MPTITQDELRAEIDVVLARHDVDFEQFVARGETDELDGELRDLWLLTKAVLVQT